MNNFHTIWYDRYAKERPPHAILSIPFVQKNQHVRHKNFWKLSSVNLLLKVKYVEGLYLSLCLFLQFSHYIYYWQSSHLVPDTLTTAWNINSALSLFVIKCNHTCSNGRTLQGTILCHVSTVRTISPTALCLATKCVPAILHVQQCEVINQDAVSTAIATIPRNRLIIMFI